MRWEARLGRIAPTLFEERKPNIDGTIVYFSKTPFDIVCPHFWELRWAFGCPFDCAYCYLQGTGRGNKSPKYRPINRVIKTIDKAFKDEYFLKYPSIFNSGELSDSLMNPFNMKQIVDFFETQERHKLLLLTKSANVTWLSQKPRRQTIASFSINATEIAQKWENKAPLPQQRIEAAKQLIESGYEVRIRIDPIFPVENWQIHYENLVYSILSKLPSDPTRITLGTPRGLSKTLIFAKDKSWEKTAFTENPEHSGWGKKAPSPVRKEIYTFFFDKFQTLGFDKTRIAMCKETKAMWQEMRLDYSKCLCNCVW
jgi:spore photoproduct lyase